MPSLFTPVFNLSYAFLPTALHADLLTVRFFSVQVGYPSPQTSGSTIVRSIAICAGSGGSMLVGKEADVYLTGEMSHVRLLSPSLIIWTSTHTAGIQHEVLSAVAAGKHVILCE